MSGLNALLWACAVGVVVYVVAQIIDFVAFLYNRNKIENDAIETMYKLFYSLKKEVDELKNSKR